MASPSIRGSTSDTASRTTASAVIGEFHDPKAPVRLPVILPPARELRHLPLCFSADPGAHATMVKPSCAVQCRHAIEEGWNRCGRSREPARCGVSAAHRIGRLQCSLRYETMIGDPRFEFLRKGGRELGCTKYRGSATE